MSKMNNTKRSQKLLFITTALTILALSIVIVTASVLLGTINGGIVTVGGVTSGTIAYSNDNSPGGTWSASLQPNGSWFAKLSVSTYHGPVIITWQLQSYATGSWVDVTGKTASTSVTLTGTAQDVYASNNGDNTGNHDWSEDTSTGGSFRVTATVASAP